MDDVEAEQHVRRMIMGLRGIEIARTGGRSADVRITDGALNLDRGVPVLVISDSLGAVEALEAGAVAVLSQHTDSGALAAAIRAAALGLTALSGEFRDQLIDSLRSRGGLENELEETTLTRREVQVVQLLAEGASNKSIARHLDITPHTVKFHVASVVAKLGARGRTDAVAKAMRLGLVLI